MEHRLAVDSGYFVDSPTFGDSPTVCGLVFGRAKFGHGKIIKNHGRGAAHPRRSTHRSFPHPMAFDDLPLSQLRSRANKPHASLQKVGKSARMARVYKACPIHKIVFRLRTRLPIRRPQKRFSYTNPFPVSFPRCLQKRLLPANRICSRNPILWKGPPE
jgi:hypothetical protein